MVQLTEFYKTTIHKLNSPDVSNEHRKYLGMSQIGHHCDRYLWLSFRWAYTDTLSQRVLRIFRHGHREEELIIQDLARIGVKVEGEQQGMECASGHCKGHCDGIATNVPEAPKTVHLAEFKTLNTASFKKMAEKGVQEYHPVYYAQLQMYMRFLKLTRALFICVNKNDHSYYVERVRYVKEDADLLERRAVQIVLSETCPPRLLPSTWYQCKWCSAWDVCRGFVVHDNARSCRTCVYSLPVDDGAWACFRDNVTRPLSDDMTEYNTCKSYKQVEIG